MLRQLWQFFKDLQFFTGLLLQQSTTANLLKSLKSSGHHSIRLYVQANCLDCQLDVLTVQFGASLRQLILNFSTAYFLINFRKDNDEISTSLIMPIAYINCHLLGIQSSYSYQALKLLCSMIGRASNCHQLGLLTPRGPPCMPQVTG